MTLEAQSWGAKLEKRIADEKQARNLGLSAQSGSELPEGFTLGAQRRHMRGIPVIGYGGHSPGTRPDHLEYE